MEDIAYCLLGLFDVNMPLLYGEGRKAFVRLQHEIINQSDDESIFAWTLDPGQDGEERYHVGADMFADSPKCYAASGSLESTYPSNGTLRRHPCHITKKGLEIGIPPPFQSQLPAAHTWEFALLQLDAVWMRPFQRTGYYADNFESKVVFVILSRFAQETWSRVALPYHIVGHPVDMQNSKTIRVRGWLGRTVLTLQKLSGQTDVRAIDIGKNKDVLLADLGLCDTNNRMHTIEVLGRA